jgi:hypothetical protein
MRFSEKCIPWINTTACSPHMAKSFSLMCQVFFGITCVIGVFFAVSVLRRIWYIREKQNLFTVIAPQLTAWAPMQIFYCMIVGFVPQNHNFPAYLITTSNLMSSMILGNTIPQLIVTWMEIKQKTESMKSARYQKQYWISIGVFTLTATIASILTGINATYYFIFMRILLGIWTSYLIICCIMFFYFGIKMYVLTTPIKTIPHTNSKEDSSPTLQKRKSGPLQADNARDDTRQAHVYVLAILITLGFIIFIPVIAFFIFYIVKTEFVEQSSWLPLFIWAFFKVTSALYTGFWGVYFWRSTTYQLRANERSDKTRSSASTRNSYPN